MGLNSLQRTATTRRLGRVHVVTFKEDLWVSCRLDLNVLLKKSCHVIFMLSKRIKAIWKYLMNGPGFAWGWPAGEVESQRT